MKRALRRARAAVWGLLGVTELLLGCGSQDKPRGELMVVVASDMSIPENLNQVEIEVLDDSGKKQLFTYPILPSLLGQPMPGTLAIVPPDAGGQHVRVRMIAELDPGDGSAPVPRVVREAAVNVPTDRIAMLPMPLHWLCDGHVKKDEKTGTYSSGCDDGETCVAGKCKTATFAPAQLLDFEPARVFGGGDSNGAGGRCIDIAKCFAGGAVLTPDAECSVPVPSGVRLDALNVALVSTAGDGICLEGGEPCLVPLDRDEDEGWKTDGSSIQLPSTVCDQIESGKIGGVSVSSECPTKTAAVPLCGPWTLVTTPSSLSDLDGAGGGGASVETGGTDGVGGSSNQGASGGASSGGQSGRAGGGNATAGAGPGEGGSGSSGGSSTGGKGVGGAAPGTAGIGTAGASTGGDATACDGECVPATASGKVPLIDDFEDGDTALAGLSTTLCGVGSNDQRSGYWYTYNDGSSDQQTPAPGTIPTPITTNCRSGTRCMETKSSVGYAKYAALGISFNNRPGAKYDCAYNASAYQGVRFWVRGSGTLRFQWRTVNLHGAMTTSQGTCVSGSDVEQPSSQCYDFYGQTILLTEAWKLVQVPFSTMTQEDWGGTQISAPLDLTQALGLNFYVENGLPFDVVIDDVSFY